MLRVPPPTRRCTRAACVCGVARSGSSAHAEMHRISSCASFHVRGFLRPRGDAPHHGSCNVDVGEVPPPTRRCTHRLPGVHRRHRGSSAHAEMHRAIAGLEATVERFLRPRGDAPPGDRRYSGQDRVPPPTRRCTRLRFETSRQRAGSSAHAEMHRRAQFRKARRRRFLRPRGDAPPTLQSR